MNNQKGRLEVEVTAINPSEVGELSAWHGKRGNGCYESGATDQQLRIQDQHSRENITGLILGNTDHYQPFATAERPYIFQWRSFLEFSFTTQILPTMRNATAHPRAEAVKFGSAQCLANGDPGLKTQGVGRSVAQSTTVECDQPWSASEFHAHPWVTHGLSMFPNH